jgi:hypothetical protein
VSSLTVASLAIVAVATATKNVSLVMLSLQYHMSQHSHLSILASTLLRTFTRMRSFPLEIYLPSTRHPDVRLGSSMNSEYSIRRR